MSHAWEVGVAVLLGPACGRGVRLEIAPRAALERGVLAARAVSSALMTVHRNAALAPGAVGLAILTRTSNAIGTTRATRPSCVGNSALRLSRPGAFCSECSETLGIDREYGIE